MKKMGFILLTLAPVMQVSLARCGGGGDAVAAGIAAGMFTGIATSAIANSGRSEAEIDARRAREEAVLLRREHEQEKIEQIRREATSRELMHKDERMRQLDEHIKNVERQQRMAEGGNLVWILMGLVGVLLVALMGMGVVILRHRR